MADYHSRTYLSEEDFYNENLGKGVADPEIVGFPGEVEKDPLHNLEQWLDSLGLNDGIATLESSLDKEVTR